MIARLRACARGSSGGEFDDIARTEADGANPPGAQVGDDAQHGAILRDIERVYGKAHKEHVDAGAGVNDQAAAFWQAGLAQQPHRARHERIGQSSALGQHRAARGVDDSNRLQGYPPFLRPLYTMAGG